MPLERPRGKQEREWLDDKPVGGEFALMKRGEIWLVGLDPAEGQQQEGRRAGPDHSAGGFQAGHPKCPGAKTTGCVRCDWPRALDLAAGHGYYWGHRLKPVLPE